MSEQRLPAEYARRPCGLFIEIAACNIDTEHQECHTAFDGDIQDLKLLDFAPIIVREPEPGRFLLVNEEDRCRLHKQLAVGKKWILALDENDPNYNNIVDDFIQGDKPHDITLSAVALCWGVEFASYVNPPMDDFYLWNIWDKDLKHESVILHCISLLVTFPRPIQIAMLDLSSTTIRKKIVAPFLYELLARVEHYLKHYN